jgi:hypothetical protein
MAIECKRCGGPTMSETVIKLRRSIIGFRETRWQGAYCTACRLSVPIQDPPAIRSVAVQPRTRLGGYLLTWLRGTPGRSVRGGMGTLRLSGPVRNNWRTARMPS